MTSIGPATSQWVGQYGEQGYLTGLAILNPDEVLAYRRAFADLETRYGQEKTQLKIVDQHFYERFIWDLASHPKVLDWVECAMGPDIVLLATHFFCKYPDMGQQIVPWHQDTAYFGLEPQRACTIWLAIDDVEVENGCMRLIPSSHKSVPLEHGPSDSEGKMQTGSPAVSDEAVDLSRTVDICLSAGCASLHDGLLLHSSHPNRSSRRRCGLTLRYTSPEVKMVLRASRSLGVTPEKSPQGFSPILVRGQDPFGHLPLVPPPFDS